MATRRSSRLLLSRTLLTLLTDVLLRVPYRDVEPGVAGRNLILYNVYNETGLVSGSRPILDSKGLKGAPWPIHLTDNVDPALIIDTGLRVQFVGCSLSTSTGLVTIDATTNQMLGTASSLQGASAHSTWADWKPVLEQSNTCVTCTDTCTRFPFSTHLTASKTHGPPCSFRMQDQQDSGIINSCLRLRPPPYGPASPICTASTL